MKKRLLDCFDRNGKNQGPSVIDRVIGDTLVGGGPEYGHEPDASRGDDQHDTERERGPDRYSLYQAAKRLPVRSLERDPATNSDPTDQRETRTDEHTHDPQRVRRR